MFEYIENILPIELAEKICKGHFSIKDSDKSSYEHWPKSATKANTLPEVFIELLPKSVVLEITSHLYSHPESPFYGDKLIRNTDGAVQKYPTNSTLPMHRDRALYSVTVFLNKDWKAEEGGQFRWIEDSYVNSDDEESNRIVHMITPKFNCGVVYKGNMEATSELHGMPTNTSHHNRVSLQLFVWKPSINVESSVDFGQNQ